MNKPRKWIDYNAEQHGNPFYFVLREAARRRDALETEQMMQMKPTEQTPKWTS